jgi:hypothetical protein
MNSDSNFEEKLAERRLKMEKATAAKLRRHVEFQVSTKTVYPLWKTSLMDSTAQRTVQ